MLEYFNPAFSTSVPFKLIVGCADVSSKVLHCFVVCLTCFGIWYGKKGGMCTLYRFNPTTVLLLPTGNVSYTASILECVQTTKFFLGPWNY